VKFFAALSAALATANANLLGFEQTA
jgi:hypothetical protein